MKISFFKYLFTLTLITFIFKNSVAATRNWVGGTSTSWTDASNWHEGAVPVAGDVVQIAINYDPNSIPVIGSGTVNVGSVAFGGQFYASTGYSYPGITVNSGATLNITGNITIQTDIYPGPPNQFFITGGGAITAANMYVYANYGSNGGTSNVEQLITSSINSLTLSGSLTLESENYKTGGTTYNQTAYFNQTAGTVTIGGGINTINIISTAGVAYPASDYVITPASSAGATLALNGATPFSGLSSSGINFITLNNTYTNVTYGGSSQTIYNSSANAYGGISYYNLNLNGSSTETAASGTLTVSNNLSLAPAAAMTLDLNANSTISNILNFTSNSLSTIKQGSGQNFTVTGTANNAGTFNLVGNSSCVFSGTTGLTNSGTINGLSGYGSQQNFIINNGPLTNSGTINWYGINGVYASTITTAALVNSGTINQSSAGTITVSGAVTNSGYITKTGGLFYANAGFTNSGIFTGATSVTGSNTYVTGAYINSGNFTCNAENVYYAGNYTNTGNFSAGTGTGMVYFDGSTQTLLDNSTPGTLFKNVTFNGSGTATISSGSGNFAVSAAGSLYMVSPAKLVAGTTIVGGAAYLTIMSGASSTATVYTPSGTTITGNINVQRYITSGSLTTRGYRLLTSPVNVSLSIAGAGNLGLSYLDTNAAFGGTVYYGSFTEGPGIGFSTSGSTNPIIYLYDESRPTNNNSFVSGKNIGVYSITGSLGIPAYSVVTLGGSPAIITAGVSVPVGNSYLLYYVGSNQSTSVIGTRVPDATTLTASGYLNQGNVTVKFWKTASTTIPYDVTTGTVNWGLNQIGNPYASTINLNTLYTDNYNAASNPIGSAFYELIPAGSYVSYNASNGFVSDSRASQYIVSGQGFLIQAGSASPAETVTFKEDQKIAYPSSFTATTTPKMMLDVNPLAQNTSAPSKAINHVETNAIVTPVTIPANGGSGLHLQISKDSTYFAQTGVYFTKSATDKYRLAEDAVQVDGGTPLVYLSSYSADNTKLSINALSDYTNGKRIRLYANVSANGSYSLSLANIIAMDTVDYAYYLVDNLLKDSTDLIHSKTYTCNLNPADTTSVGANRFVLAIEHKPVPPYKLSRFTGAKVPTGVQLNWLAINAGNYTGYTLQKLDAGGTFESLYSVQSENSVNAYDFIDTHPVIGNNVYRLAQNDINGNITYSASVTVGYSSTTPPGALTLYPNPATSIINVNLTSGTNKNPTYLVSIYNSQGVLVNDQTVSGDSWTDDVSAYKLGVYIMEVKGPNGKLIAQAKFVKLN